MAPVPFAVTDRSYQPLQSVRAGVDCKAFQNPTHDFVGAVVDRELTINRILVGAVGDREPS